MSDSKKNSETSSEEKENPQQERDQEVESSPVEEPSFEATDQAFVQADLEAEEEEVEQAEELLDDELFLSPDDEGGEVLELDSVAEDEVAASPEDEALEQLQESKAQADGQIAELTAQLAGREQELAQAREELELTRQERDDFNNRMLRVAADLENYRRRTERDKEDLRRYGIDKVVLELIPAVDDMERALTHASDRGEDSSMVEGVRMVYRKILGALKKYGVEGFESKGEPFDPQLHEAIQQVERTDVDTGTIVEEYQKGYFLHDRLLRPALVVVAKRVDSPQEEAQQEAPEHDEVEDSASDADQPVNEVIEGSEEEPETDNLEPTTDPSQEAE